MGEGRGSCQWFRVWWNQKGYSTHEKELFKLDVLTNFDADRRFDENKCFPNNTHKGMTSQRQIKFLLQIFLFWYIINFTGNYCKGGTKSVQRIIIQIWFLSQQFPFFLCMPCVCHYIALSGTRTILYTDWNNPEMEALNVIASLVEVI